MKGMPAVRLTLGNSNGRIGSSHFFVRGLKQPTEFSNLVMAMKREYGQPVEAAAEVTDRLACDIEMGPQGTSNERDV